MGILAGQIKFAKRAYKAIQGATTTPRPAQPAAQPAPAAPAAPPVANEPAPRFTTAQVRSMDDRLGKAGPLVIRGGRRGKNGPRYSEGEFKGMTAGQAYAQITADLERGGVPASPNSRGGRSAPLSPSNGTMGTQDSALDRHAAMQQTSLAADKGLAGRGQRVSNSWEDAGQQAVRDFANSPGVKARQHFEKVDPTLDMAIGKAKAVRAKAEETLQRTAPMGAPVAKPGVLPAPSVPNGAGKAVASRLFGTAPGQSPGYASPGAAPAAAADPVADFRRSLSSLAAPGAPMVAQATPAAPAAATKVPAASPSPEKRRPA